MTWWYDNKDIDISPYSKFCETCPPSPRNRSTPMQTFILSSRPLGLRTFILCKDNHRLETTWVKKMFLLHPFSIPSSSDWNLFSSAELPRLFHRCILQCTFIQPHHTYYILYVVIQRSFRFTYFWLDRYLCKQYGGGVFVYFTMSEQNFASPSPSPERAIYGFVLYLSAWFCLGEWILSSFEIAITFDWQKFRWDVSLTGYCADNTFHQWNFIRFLNLFKHKTLYKCTNVAVICLKCRLKSDDV